MNATETIETTYSALSEQSKKALEILDKISGSNFSISELARIKMPSNGDTSFTVQTSGIRKKVQCIDGIVIAQNDVRTLWKKDKNYPFPICFSNDCISGIGNPGGDCSSCSLGQFSSNNHSSNCQQRKTVLILRREDILPVVLVAPPKSAKALSEYFLNLAANRIRPCFAETSFSLKQEKNIRGIQFSKINAQIKRLLIEEEKQIVAVYANKFSRLLNAQSCIY